MATRIWQALALCLALALPAAGCLGTPDVDSQVLGLDLDPLPSDEAGLASLAEELRMPAGECASLAEEARGQGRRVDWRRAGDLRRFLFVEIDGAMACAMGAGTRIHPIALIHRDLGTNPDEGGPNPEPASGDEDKGGPNPEPATPDDGDGAGDEGAGAGAGAGANRQGGEDEGGPNPEPALGDGGGEDAQAMDGSGAGS